jgi:hypothetical protein
MQGTIYAALSLWSGNSSSLSICAHARNNLRGIELMVGEQQLLVNLRANARNNLRGIELMVGEQQLLVNLRPCEEQFTRH